MSNYFRFYFILLSLFLMMSPLYFLKKIISSKVKTIQRENTLTSNIRKDSILCGYQHLVGRSEVNSIGRI